MSAPIILVLRVLLVSAVYAFLVGVLVSLWKVLQVNNTQINTRKITPITITVHTEEGSPGPFRFSQGDVLIGRDRACQIVLVDQAVSNQHALLRFHHGQWWLEDLNSTNGTYLNHAKVTMPTVLAVNDEITIGNTKTNIVFHLDQSDVDAPLSDRESK